MVFKSFWDVSLLVYNTFSQANVVSGELVKSFQYYDHYCYQHHKFTITITVTVFQKMFSFPFS